MTETGRRQWHSETAQAIVDRRRDEAGAMLPILHDLQETFGYVDREAVPMIADALNLSRAEVHGVMTFYHDFRSEPAGRTVVRICMAEACQSMGCRDLAAHAERRHGVALGDTSADRELTVEEVFCLGNCALSPAVMIDGALFGRVTPERFDDLVAAARDGRLA